ncbi:MAG TPA: hypothetical protein VK870_03485 [Ignavibacteriaceae bacterium]|nr:hypothetical protein [Ignavibacteriaceae bacterium]
MAKVKNVQTFCSYCGAERTIELVKGAFSDDAETKQWGKCKKCKQMIMIDITHIQLADGSSKNMETENAVEYSPKNTFEIGAAIYHKGWDDFGLVTGKEILSTGQKSITVDFQKSGIKKLIESITNQSQQSEVN